MNRACLACRLVGAWRGPRCPACGRIREAQRNADRAGRYDAKYRATRAGFKGRMTAGVVYRCSRCGEAVDLNFHLDHTPDGLWPAHPHCNMSARRNA